MGLYFLRDKLCLVQISSGKSDAHIVQLDRSRYNAPNLKNFGVPFFFVLIVSKSSFKMHKQQQAILMI